MSANQKLSMDEAWVLISKLLPNAIAMHPYGRGATVHFRDGSPTQVLNCLVDWKAGNGSVVSWYSPHNWRGAIASDVRGDNPPICRYRGSVSSPWEYGFLRGCDPETSHHYYCGGTLRLHCEVIDEPKQEAVADATVRVPDLLHGWREPTSSDAGRTVFVRDHAGVKWTHRVLARVEGKKVFWCEPNDGVGEVDWAHALIVDDVVF